MENYIKCCFNRTKVLGFLFAKSYIVDAFIRLMAEIYSNSKLTLFENCREAYKIKYVDKTFPEIPPSINAFLGIAVHESLEELYVKIGEGIVLELDELIKIFAENWHKTFSPTMRIKVGEKVEDYFNTGIKFLIDYYNSNYPFGEKVIDLEKKIFFPLDSDKKYFIVGYIDRLVLNKNGEYEVHDYKTNANLKSQSEIDKDRQLAFYHLGLKDLFGNDVKVKLIWHFLAHNKKIISFRDEWQLESLRNDTLNLITDIEKNKDWFACGRPWCDWCSWKAKHGNVKLTKKNFKNVNYRDSLLGEFI